MDFTEIFATIISKMDIGSIFVLGSLVFYLAKSAQKETQKTIKEWRDEHSIQINEWRVEHGLQINEWRTEHTKQLADNENHWRTLFLHFSAKLDTKMDKK